LVDHAGSNSTIRIMTTFANLLADGRAPTELAPWIAGANGHAFRKKTKLGADPARTLDPRPVCTGEAWRRLVGKALLGTESDTINAFLLPWQLAVGTPGGAEALAHAVRGWREAHADDDDRVFLDFDETNAYNTVDRASFLARMQIVFPGLSRWLRWIYPLGAPTWVVWAGKLIESRAGGHQGCPLMSLCHAAVQRAIPEALGLCELWPGTKALVPKMEPAPDVDLLGMYADDGIIAGRQGDMSRIARHLHEHIGTLGLTFGKLQAVPANPQHNLIDVASFVQAGCTFCHDGNVEVMRVPIGDDTWSLEYSRGRADDTLDVFTELAKLPSSHVGLYLARYQSGRANYILRTTPRRHCSSAITAIDAGTHALLQGWLGREVPDAAWTQATLPQRFGGLGLLCCDRVADAAYIASREKTEGLVVGLQVPAAQQAQANPRGQCFQEALGRYSVAIHTGCISPPSTVHEDEWMTEKTQKALTHKISCAVAHTLWRNSGPNGRANLQAQSAPFTGSWLTPAPAADIILTESQFATILAYRLGVDLEQHQPRLCRFCGAVRDLLGRHDQSCTAGGDIVFRHNGLRDLLYNLALRALADPEIERAGLLSEPGMLLDLRRPADVLVKLARASQAHRPCSATERVAIDIKVINACGPHHATTGETPDPQQAMSKYAEQARIHQDTELRCKAQGIVYKPLVFTAQGGVSKEAEELVTQLAQLVEKHEGVPMSKVKGDFMQEASLLLARQAARAHARRRGPPRLTERSGRLADELVRASRRHAEASPEGDDTD
jgi:hypothetical protein